MQTHWSLHLLLTDQLLWLIVGLLLAAVLYISRQPHLRLPWINVFSRPMGMSAFTVLLLFSVIALLDSIHVQVTAVKGDAVASVQVVSVLDAALPELSQHYERSYSAPFADHSFVKTTLHKKNKDYRGYAPLKYVGKHNYVSNRGWDIGLRCVVAVVLSTLILGAWLLIAKLIFINRRRGSSTIAWRTALITLWISLAVIISFVLLSANYHILGTNQVGQDVFYETVKSIRTGLIIGTLTTLFTLPFALFLGAMAGYFGGWIDDVIQYIYTTLSSIPGVLLISASLLVLQVYINSHPLWFPSMLDRADARLLSLCVILGITSWAGLCRLLRAETLKLREQEFVMAARSLGIRATTIIFRHIIPNVMHIVLITLVLDFSGLVLAEAVLSYVGVGVDPTMMSWGNMINSARLELARSPAVWWPLVAALLLMFGFVLSANLFAECVRDAFDPREQQAE